MAGTGSAGYPTQREKQSIIEPSMPRVVVRQQLHAETPKDQYKRALTIDLLDNLISEIYTYFGSGNNAVEDVFHSAYILAALLILLVKEYPVQAAM